MKKLLLTAVAVFAFGFANAQEQTKKGNWIIEANTGSFATGSTAFGFTSNEAYSAYSLGLDGGYFVANNLAIKVGLGFAGQKLDGFKSTSSITYKVGAQYYIINKIPVGVDITGLSTKNSNNTWVGVEGGYAIYLSKNVALTPKLRYNVTLDETKGLSSFQGLVGFSLFF